MIGQTKLKEELSELIERDAFPPFTIIVGDEGSGRNILVRELMREHKKTLYELPDVRVETIRQMIADAYKTNAEVFYLIPDADTMSPSAKGALLKITEEPAHNAKIIMTLCAIGNTLDTIRSRAQVWSLACYEFDDLLAFYKKMPEYDRENAELVLTACTTPGQIQQIVSVSTSEFIAFVQKVIHNVVKVQGANAFKIGAQLNLGKDETKYDLSLFLRTFRAMCLLDDSLTDSEQVLGVIETTKCIHYLNLGYNKLYIFDEWLLNIRRAWR